MDCVSLMLSTRAGVSFSGFKISLVMPLSYRLYAGPISILQQPF